MAGHSFNRENHIQHQNPLNQIPIHEPNLREATEFKLYPNNLNREDGLISDRSWMSTTTTLRQNVSQYSPSKGHRQIAYLSRMVSLAPSLLLPLSFLIHLPKFLGPTHLQYLSHSLLALWAFSGQPTFCPSRHWLSWIDRPTPSSSYPWDHSHSPTATCFIPVFSYTSSHPTDHCHLLSFACDFHTLSTRVYSITTPTVFHVLPLYITMLSHAKVATTT